MKKSREEAGWFGERQGLYAILLLAAVILIGVGYLLFGFSVGSNAEQETLSQYEYDSESSVAASDPVSDIPAINAQEDDADEAEDEEDDEEDN